MQPFITADNVKDAYWRYVETSFRPPGVILAERRQFASELDVVASVPPSGRGGSEMLSDDEKEPELERVGED